jgi:hypothetical protein
VIPHGLIPIWPLVNDDYEPSTVVY